MDDYTEVILTAPEPGATYTPEYEPRVEDWSKFSLDAEVEADESGDQIEGGA